MARPVTLLAFFFIALSLFSATLSSTGVAQTLHLDSRVGGSEARNDATSATDVETNAPTGSTLFGLYNVLSIRLSQILSIFNPGLVMLYNAGTPAWLVGDPNGGELGLLPPLVSLVKVIGTISFLRGWDL